MTTMPNTAEIDANAFEESTSPECHTDDASEAYAHDGEETDDLGLPKATGKPCPLCGEDLLLKTGRLGAFIGCSAYPDCLFTVDPNDPIEAPPTCPICDAPMRKRQGHSGAFYGCSRYPDCRGMRDASGEPISPNPTASKPRETEQSCPLCGHAMLEHDGRRGSYLRCTNRSCNKTIDVKGLEAAAGEVCGACKAPMVVRHGARGTFLACSRYPECKRTMDLDPEQVEAGAPAP
jgi:ssDNA-binding Zn-finger/Zn-ribbon topoisomerase 1